MKLVPCRLISILVVSFVVSVGICLTYSNIHAQGNSGNGGGGGTSGGGSTVGSNGLGANAGAGILWSTEGNMDTDPSLEFLGTTDDADLVIKTNSEEKVRVTTDGNVEVTGTLNVTGGDAADDTPGKDITIQAQNGGVDGDLDGVGGAGGNIILQPGVSMDDVSLSGNVYVGEVGSNDTEKLIFDVNGHIRIRGSFPEFGFVLTALDSDGTASWKPIDRYTDAEARAEVQGDIDANSNAITTNTTNIGTNDTDIAANATNIGTHDTDIAANTTNIGTHDTDIATNATNIGTHDTDIAANTANIGTNDTGINTNVTDIGINKTGISTNTAAIASNDTDIAYNITAIAADKDIDPENELNTLISLDNANQLQVTDAGGTLKVDLSSLKTEVDPEYSAWDKSDGVEIEESQISNLNHFKTADETDPQVGEDNEENYLSKWNGSALVKGTIFDNGSNVGIGTAEPESRLEIEGDSQTVFVGLTLDDKTSSAPSKWMITTNWTPGKLNFRDMAASANRMVINSVGNIGIGTDNPIDKLTVAGNIVPSVSDTFTLGTAGNVWKDVYVGNNSLHIGGVRLSSNEDGILKWNDKPLSGMWSDVTGGINYDGGKVGIGTTSPSNTLTVQTETQFDGFVLKNGSGNVLGKIAKNSTYGYLGLFNNDGDRNVLLRNDGVSYLNGGNVGIGTSGPVAKLDIMQTPRSGTHPSSVKGLYVTGDFGTYNDGVEFRHSNGTQGIGISYTSIYATGTNANQGVSLVPRGTGSVNIKNGNLSFSSKSTTTIGYPAPASGNYGALRVQAGSTAYSGTATTGGNLELRAGDYNVSNNTRGGHVFISTGKNVHDGSGNPSIVFQAGGSKTTHTERMRINGDNGNVGIGKTNPSSKLDVNGIVTAAKFIGNGSGLTHLPVSAGKWLGTGKIYYNGGNVGIGTSAPGHKLHVSDRMKLDGDRAGMWIESGTKDWFVGKAADSSNLRFFNNNVDRVTITPGGKVGIGKDNPRYKLDVGGNISGTVLIQKRNDNGDHNRLSHNGTTSFFDAGGAEEGLQFRVGTGTAALGTQTYRPVLKLQPNGKVGIGTTAPEYPLHVAGTGKFGNVIVGGKNDAGVITGKVGIGVTNPQYELDMLNGTIRVKEILEPSDIRLKEEINTIENALQKVYSMRGVSFVWKDKSRGGKVDVGVIAQEVEKVVPAVVSTDSEGMKSVNYAKLVGVLIEAVKELKDKNDVVKSENIQLKDKLAALSDRQSAIEDMLLALTTDLSKEKVVKLDTSVEK